MDLSKREMSGSAAEGCGRNGSLKVRKLPTNVFCALLLSERRSTTPRIGYRKMPSRSITLKMLGIAFVSLLLCAIFASELPELLSLTDNAANDFTVRSADSLASPVLDCSKNVRKPTIEFTNSTQDSLLGRMCSPEKTEFCTPLLLALYSVLRT